MSGNMCDGNSYFKDDLKRISHKLAISPDELIERYIRRGLFEDDYFKRPQLPLRFS